MPSLWPPNGLSSPACHWLIKCDPFHSQIPGIRCSQARECRHSRVRDYFDYFTAQGRVLQPEPGVNTQNQEQEHPRPAGQQQHHGWEPNPEQFHPPMAGFGMGWSRRFHPTQTSLGFRGHCPAPFTLWVLMRRKTKHNSSKAEQQGHTWMRMLRVTEFTPDLQNQELPDSSN